jgi:hypothetical protein
MLNRLSTTATAVALAASFLFVTAWVISGLLFALTSH